MKVGTPTTGMINTQHGVHSLLVDSWNPKTIYAGTSGGAYKSIDGGASWTLINTGFLNIYPIRALAMDPTSHLVIYAALEGGCLYKSVDAGAHWNVLVYPGPATANVDMLNNPFMFSLAIDPFAANTLYAGNDVGMIFKSTDYGVTWTTIASSLPQQTIVEKLVTDPTNRSTVYASLMGGGVWKSTDGGTSWSNASRGIATIYVCALAMDPTNSSTLYVGDQSGGIWKTVDGGSSWSGRPTGAGAFVENISVAPSAPATIYAATAGRGIWKSTDAGQTWFQASGGIATSDLDLDGLAVDPSSAATVYAGSELQPPSAIVASSYGVYKTTTGGQ